MFIVDGIKSYGASLPLEIPTAIFKSAVYSFGVSMLFVKDIRMAQMASIGASVVALVDALTLPIFRYFLADQYGDLEWYQHTAAILINLSIAQTLIEATTKLHEGVGFSRINLIAVAGIIVSLDLFFYGFNKHGTSHARAYLYP